MDTEPPDIFEALVMAHKNRAESFYGPSVTAKMLASRCGLTVAVARGQLQPLVRQGVAEKTDDSPAWYSVTEKGLRDWHDAKALT